MKELTNGEYELCEYISYLEDKVEMLEHKLKQYEKPDSFDEDLYHYIEMGMIEVMAKTGATPERLMQAIKKHYNFS